MVDILTGKVEDRETSPGEQGRDPAAVALGRKGGLKGEKRVAQARHRSALRNCAPRCRKAVGQIALHVQIQVVRQKCDLRIFRIPACGPGEEDRAKGSRSDNERP